MTEFKSYKETCPSLTQEAVYECIAWDVQALLDPRNESEYRKEFLSLQLEEME